MWAENWGLTVCPGLLSSADLSGLNKTAALDSTCLNSMN